MQHGDEAVGELERRLERYPAQRYPIQHATAQFHLGVALTQTGDLPRAETALATAAQLFDAAGMATEHGKAMNALGTLLRARARHGEAEAVLARAVAAFEAEGLRAEQGAALFNLGLVRREAGRPGPGLEALEAAARLFDEADAPAQAAAAARELGAARLAVGDLEEAREALERGFALAGRAGDVAGAGAAANVLGLVHLAAGRPGEAVEAFRDALGAHPRGVRPAEHAMARANLALAHERAGDALRARLAARQALGVPAAPEPVRAQAEAIVQRLGGGPGDVLAVLDEEDEERRPAVVREELQRWVDAPVAERRVEAGAWIDGHLARGDAAAELAVAWVGALLELPPAAMEAVMRSVVEALAQRDAEAQQRFRADVARASARFHVPQLLRVRDTFNRLAADAGEEPAWS